MSWLTRRHDPLTSLLMTIPVFLLYHVGILLPFVRLRNGVDLVSGAMLGLLNQSFTGYLALTVGYCVAIAGAAAFLRKKGRLEAAQFMPMLIESAVLAVFMSFTVGWATSQIVPWQIGGSPLNPIEKLVMSAGAGFHEELIFRVLLFGGGAALLERFGGLSRLRAGLIAAVVSAVLFSAVHYVGALGDSLQLSSFVFRTLAGLYLAAVYRFRGFAVAVYTHALYDVLVFFIFQ